ncbi:MAG: hypothetical protein CM1200mP20_00760 [Pseudomonadota bacterium]|nr:MAG: hypothetical protein CM1200mP20_00760 [Pseudomonadota bacterium]
MGYDSLTVGDHLLTAPGLYGGSWLDPLMVLACARVRPKSFPLGTNILVVPIRHPVLLAKELATLDHMSGGRFFFGVGPGWNEPEFTSRGISMRERGRRTDEILDAVKLLLTEENVSFSGKFFSVRRRHHRATPRDLFPSLDCGWLSNTGLAVARSAIHGQDRSRAHRQTCRCVYLSGVRQHGMGGP